MIKLLFKPVLWVCIIAGLLTGCSLSAKPEIQALYGYAMGTSYSIKVVSSVNDARALQLGIEGVLADIDNRMSTYKPTSDISKFALLAPNQDLEVDVKTAEVVQKALQIAAITDGAFDPTIAPLVDLWGFGPTARSQTVPDSAAIADQLANVGYLAVSVDVSKSTLRKVKPRELDLSAIAKGYAVDEVAEFLDARGMTDYLVEVGGEMRTSGVKPNGDTWAIAIEKPVVNERAPFRILQIEQGAIATSGDYRNYFELNGRRYSHTINPRTGYPVDHTLASVTVVMDSCIEADAYATAFNVMGVEKAFAMAESLKIATFLIYREGEEFKTLESTAFKARFGSLIN